MNAPTPDKPGTLWQAFTADAPCVVLIDEIDSSKQLDTEQAAQMKFQQLMKLYRAWRHRRWP